MADREPEPGRVKPPYGGLTHCPNVDCEDDEFTEEKGVYMHKDLRSGKLVLLCGPCSREAELIAREYLPLLAL